MKKSGSGFTIVEILIVIVVIAILAIISIVAYNGMQQRAANIKTTAALTAWIKALNHYKVDNGQYPPGWMCLGEDYGYGESGQESSGAQCRMDLNGTGLQSSVGFNNSMKPYFNNGSAPTPAMITATNGSGTWRRGLSYAYTGGSGNITYVLATYSGNIVCPSVSGVALTRTSFGDNVVCHYTLEVR